MYPMKFNSREELEQYHLEQKKKYKGHGFFECDDTHSQKIWELFLIHSNFQSSTNGDPGFTVVPSSPCVTLETHELSLTYDEDNELYQSYEQQFRLKAASILSYVKKNSSPCYVFSVNHACYQFHTNEIGESHWPYDLLSPFNFVVTVSSDCSCGFFSSPYRGMITYGYEYSRIPEEYRFPCSYREAV